MPPTHMPEPAPESRQKAAESPGPPSAGVSRRSTPPRGAQAGAQSLDEAEAGTQAPGTPDGTHTDAGPRELARLRAERAVLVDMFAGFERLLVTSARDWGRYRVDAWLYAVLVGWDCDDPNDPCDSGAMDEIAQAHGWDTAAVAKARRYRDAVRRVQARHGEDAS